MKDLITYPDWKDYLLVVAISLGVGCMVYLLLWPWGGVKT